MRRRRVSLLPAYSRPCHTCTFNIRVCMCVVGVFRSLAAYSRLCYTCTLYIRYTCNLCIIHMCTCRRRVPARRAAERDALHRHDRRQHLGTRHPSLTSARPGRPSTAAGSPVFIHVAVNPAADVEVRTKTRERLFHCDDNQTQCKHFPNVEVQRNRGISFSVGELGVFRLFDKTQCAVESRR